MLSLSHVSLIIEWDSITGNEGFPEKFEVFVGECLLKGASSVRPVVHISDEVDQ